MKLESQKEERGHGVAVMCEERMPETFAQIGSHDEDPRKISCGLERKKEKVILMKNTECILHNLLSRGKKPQQSFISSEGRALILHCSPL